MKRLNGKFITGMLGILSAMLLAMLAFGMVGCDQATGPEEQQEQGSEQPAAEEGATYVGATEDGTPVELTIEDGTYAVTVGGEEVSRGTATEEADGAWTLQPEDGEAFTAKAGEDGLTIEGPITEGLNGEDLRELYPAEAAPPDGGEADYRISLDAPAVYVFPAKAEGYADAEALTVTITNEGSQKTGKLTVALSGTDSGSFKLGKLALASIAADGTAAFTVTPKTKLAAGTYNAKVTVNGGNGISAGFNVRFTVNEPEEPVDQPEEPVYGISLDVEDDYTFPEAVEGYEAQEPLAVTITNTGTAETGKLTLNVSNTDFTLNKQTIANIAVEGEDSFTVAPKTGLKAGTYTATVSVTGGNGISAEFEVNFKAGAAVFGIELSQKETLVFPSENAGYTPLTAREVSISNSGNQPTGALTLTVSNANFRVSNGTIASIAVADTAGFTVVPGGNLAVGPYSATVTVSGSNGISAGFEVSFEVTPVPDYRISLSETDTLVFEEAVLGYGDITPQAITVTNKGNQPTGGLTIGVSNDDFTLSKQTIDSLAVNGSADFTVVPKTGLAAADAPYTATVSVTGGNGISKSFEVSFTVIATYGVELSETGTYPFPPAILGYGAQGAKTVNITNTGNQPTGALAIGLTGTGSDSFTVAPTTITGLAVNGSAPFTVVPNLGLSAGTHTATVTVSGANGIFAGLNVSFEVTAVYSISLDAGEAHTFPEAIFGYGAQGAKTVIISNNGDQPTGNLTVSAGAYFEVTTPANGAVSSIPVGETATFSVRPKIGLSAGTHSATVTVSGANGISAEFGVSFYVIAATYGVTLSQTAAHTFPEAIFGYPAQAALSVTITNTGNQPTGALTVALGGTNNTSFTVAPTTIANIAVDNDAEFTVVPALGLSAGTHTATVTVSGGNGITASFGVSFYVIAATYGVTLSQTGPLVFDAADFGYSARTPQTITVTNTGNRPTGNLAVALTGANYDSFTVAPTTITSIAAGSSGSFTVAPKTGLAEGTHGTAVTVSGSNGISASFWVSFEVTPLTAAALAARMAEDKNSPSATYTLSGGAQTWTDGLSLTTANCPASVTIDGGGSVITGSANSVTGSLNRITVGAGVSLTLTNVTFDTLPLTVEAGGKLTLDDKALVSGNVWTSEEEKDIEDGAMALTVSGTLVMKAGASVKDNGVAGIVLEDNAVFTMEGGEVSRNDGGGWGGGVVMHGSGASFTMSGGVISGNVGGWGSGVFVFGQGSVFRMTDGEISGNEAMAGGGVLLWYDGTTFNMEGGVIKNNRALDVGGGVGVLQGFTAAFHMTGGEITGNTAVNNGGGLSGPVTGNPQIGGTTAPNDKGWIHGNTATKNSATNDVRN